MKISSLFYLLLLVLCSLTIGINIPSLIAEAYISLLKLNHFIVFVIVFLAMVLFVVIVRRIFSISNDLKRVRRLVGTHEFNYSRLNAKRNSIIRELNIELQRNEELTKQLEKFKT